MRIVGRVKGQPIKACSPAWIVLRRSWNEEYWMPCLSGVGYTREEAVRNWNQMMYGETHRNPFLDEREHAYTPMRKRGMAIAVKVSPDFFNVSWGR